MKNNLLWMLTAALIAAKDESGNILWSWHVWVCKGWNPDKTAHSYANGAGTMMVFMNNDYFRAVAHSVRCIKDTPTNN